MILKQANLYPNSKSTLGFLIELTPTAEHLISSLSPYSFLAQLQNEHSSFKRNFFSKPKWAKSPLIIKKSRLRTEKVNKLSMSQQCKKKQLELLNEVDSASCLSMASMLITTQRCVSLEVWRQFPMTPCTLLSNLL